MLDRTPSSFEPQAAADRALDVLADVIRAFGAHGFDVPGETASALVARCDAWARHVLVAAPPPEGEAESGRRHWRGLLEFFQQRRESEQKLVTDHVVAAINAVRDISAGLRSIFARDETIDLQIQKHLTAIEKAAASGATGDLQSLIPTALADIRVVLAERRRTVRERLSEMGHALSVMRANLNEARAEADTDALTQLHNHRAFQRTFDRTILLAEGSGEPLVLVLVDLDHFKKMNDEHGHLAGDAVLQAVSDSLVRSFPRRSDFVSRYGGEEFAILLTDVDGRTAQTLIERMLQNVRDLTVPYGRHAHRVTASAGYTMLRPGEPANRFFERADRALYQAKSGGRDRSIYLP